MKHRFCPSRRRAWRWPPGFCSRVSWSPCRRKRSTALPPTPATERPSRKFLKRRAARRITRSLVHICGMEMLNGIVSEVPERAKKLAAAFWPGPLTMVMPRGPEVSDVTCAGLDTVGVRMPSHPVVQQVIKASGVAFAAPSANLSGKPSPTNAPDTLADMDGRLPLILDGGESNVGVESTVVAVTGEHPMLLRPRLHHEGADGGRFWARRSSSARPSLKSSRTARSRARPA